MTPEELKARARRIPEALPTQGGLAVADKLIAPDCVYYGIVATAPGGEGVKR